MSFYQSVFGPLLRLVEPETAHRLALFFLNTGLRGLSSGDDDPILNTHLWGIDFNNPVGLAAGFDKNAEALDGVLGLGFGFAEIGSVTPVSQPGNLPPRLFRLTKDLAVINRMGFNNDGAEIVAGRLSQRRKKGVVGVNLGKNKTATNAVADYAKGAEILAPTADYLVVNVSSPNTPGLRALQGGDALREILSAVQEILDKGATGTARRKPLLVKIAPDLTKEDQEDIVDVALSLGIDGIIATNTTIVRPKDLRDPQKTETGGLSGRPLKAQAIRVLADIYRLSEGKIPLIGVGGIESGADAYARIRAGASLVQLYTALVFQGPSLVAKIKKDLADLLRRDGFSTVAEAVGADLR
jgi:dihydroorotate dehydrogenase